VRGRPAWQKVTRDDSFLFSQLFFFFFFSISLILMRFFDRCRTQGAAQFRQGMWCGATKIVYSRLLVQLFFFSLDQALSQCFCLLICRDKYWRIAGKRRGVKKSKAEEILFEKNREFLHLSERQGFDLISKQLTLFFDRTFPQFSPNLNQVSNSVNRRLPPRKSSDSSMYGEARDYFDYHKM
jgi:hypothetical protein